MAVRPRELKPGARTPSVPLHYYSGFGTTKKKRELSLSLAELGASLPIHFFAPRRDLVTIIDCWL